MKRMRFLSTTLILLLTISTSIAFSQTQEGDKIRGEWYTEGNESLVKIYRAVNGKYYGKIIWLKEPNRDGKPKVDDKNPDKSKQNVPIIDLLILRSFEYDGDDTWTGGTIYDPKNGKTYSCTIRMDGDKLDVRGYVGIPALGRTTVWNKKK